MSSKVSDFNVWKTKASCEKSGGGMRWPGHKKKCAKCAKKAKKNRTKIAQKICKKCAEMREKCEKNFETHFSLLPEEIWGGEAGIAKRRAWSV